MRQVGFLDDSPDPSPIPQDIMAMVQSAHDVLVAEWDKRYPENPVPGTGKESDEDD
ncbi:MAG: hypothetical protein JJU36_03105 [Phycisphaeraceae bacterium]|nr:hypothetical protein [Phycisphaeraceae bacterium]